jgi:N-acylglucosamine-6-phosphate 2-epimerase
MGEMSQIEALLDGMRGGLIVSCQPDARDAAGDPMNRAEVMAALAQAVVLGGARAVRADTPAHIAAVRAAVSVPVIGIYKIDLPGFEVRITPTVDSAVAIARAGADFLAVDGTDRPRPDDLSVPGFISAVRSAAGKPVMADISTFAEGAAAAEAGACAVLTTLSGYTSNSPAQEEPDYDLLTRLVRALDVPVIAEGRYSTPEQVARAFDCGAWAVTVGSAITRPRGITERFVRATPGSRGGGAGEGGARSGV